MTHQPGYLAIQWVDATYHRQSGEKKYRTEIVARDIVLLDSRDNGHEDKGELSGEQSSPEPAPAVDDDIPF
jgi:hypothetical protein